MGWKCPICIKDFGRDKKAQQEHIEREHKGLGADVSKLLSKITQPEQDRRQDDLNVDVYDG